ncbi:MULTISPECIES: transglutaminase domain-containing protein [unclassified Leucobacter]|uniref:transglutaminase domain-containing protein n=1 Tax=unclassified Leucobacter TaxID=2621730 RepID=UPI0030184542
MTADRGSVRAAWGALAAALAVALGVWAAWPIYGTPWLWVVAAGALILGTGIAWLRERLRWGVVVLAAVTLGVFVLTVVPVAVPEAMPGAHGGGLLRGLLDGLAAVALGWKQLLTLSLPVGSYRTVLVPAYVVFLVTALLVGVLARRGARAAVFAAAPLLAPVAFGTVFGASQLSAPLHVAGFTIVAPREIGLWLAAALVAALWVALVSGEERRAALRLGRAADGAVRGRGGALRPLVGAGIVVLALCAGGVFAPVLDAGARAVPRDRIDPELVVRERPSPLAEYRSSKRDAALDTPLFSVSSSGALPERLRVAVLDAYDGVDFHVGEAAAGRFTRFPSGTGVADPARVSVRIAEGYSDIWAPTAPLGGPPVFAGPRADALVDAFYVNRETGGAIAVPGAGASSAGLVAGDGYTAEMQTSADPGVDRIGEPGDPRFDVEKAPQLGEWIDRQQLPGDAAGLAELIERLRQRGYLSHSMSDAAGERLWLERLGEQYGTVFESSAGGHSLSRIERLFEQLNTQQSAAGESASSAQLVAGVGDDEQFATAAALIARALGFDARVVVGVRLGEADRGVDGVPACTAECTGEHLAAWVEVRGDRGEWVPFDVTPQLEHPPERLEQGEQLPEFPTTPEERDAQEADPPVGLGDQGENDDAAEPAAAPSPLWPVVRAVALALVALLLIAAPLLFLPLAKRLRARRRRAEQVPELRALGAWAEMLDRARDAGVSVPANAARSEVAAVLGTAPARWAAAEVDRAVFSPTGIDPGTAEQLWAAAEADGEERARGLSAFARLRAAYSLRSYGIGAGRRGAATRESEQG